VNHRISTARYLHLHGSQQLDELTYKEVSESNLVYKKQTANSDSVADTTDYSWNGLTIFQHPLEFFSIIIRYAEYTKNLLIVNYRPAAFSSTNS
jgi:hypothetical protein